jgi:aspartyl-tRNA synthetase
MANPEIGLMRTHKCGELRKDHTELEVSLCGWVNKYRNLGALHFIDLRDKSGLVQLSFEQWLNEGGDLSVFKKTSHETVIKIAGKIRVRPESAVNKEIPTGEIEVSVTEIKILSEADRHQLPFLPNALNKATEDLRLKYRYLDLRTNRLQKMLSIRSKAYQRARSFLHNNEFVEVETPILYKSTPEGARDYIVPSRVNPGKVYALPQSPQTLKQLLMVGGTDRYFQITKCFRDEDLRIDRQPEFTQIDIEASFCEQEYVRELASGLMNSIFEGEEVSFKTMTFKESLDKYGSDKPDTRFGLEHSSFTELFIESSFGLFQKISTEGGLVKGLFLPDSLAQMARKDLDSLTKVVEPYGGKGVAFFKVDGEETSGGISKFITSEHLSTFKKFQTENKGVWLFSADLKHSVAHACLDAVRKHLRDKYSLAEDRYDFLWIDEFPLFEFDEAENRLVAMHHPFSMPSKEALETFMNGSLSDVKDLTADCYDVVCNGYEIASGSIRIHDPKVQSRMFELLGFSKEEMQRQFGFFIEALNYGTPPHGGIAFGMDRLMMLLAKTENIRDVVAFPKTTSASDLMADAPSLPGEEQLEELNLSWLKKE